MEIKHDNTIMNNRDIIKNAIDVFLVVLTKNIKTKVKINRIIKKIFSHGNKFVITSLIGIRTLPPYHNS